MVARIPGKAFRKIYKANIFSLLLIFKFAVLLGYSWLFPDRGDLLGHYTLALGLTNSFFILSGMRARFYVIQAVQRFSQLVQLAIVMGVLGIGMVVAIYWLNTGSAFLIIIMLVSASKFVETFLDANTSFLQLKAGRDTAFGLLNQHGYMLAVLFTALAYFGLEWALLGETVLLCITVTRQWLKMAALEEEGAWFRPSEMPSVVWGGISYTITAALNAAQLTGFLYIARAEFPTEITLMISKIFAAQAIFGRLITGNNFYFKSYLDAALRRLSRKITIFSVVLAVLTALTLALILLLDIPRMPAVIAMGVAFTTINVVNILVRQHVMLVAGVSRLLVLHVVELILVLVPMAVLSLGPVFALGLLTCVRMLRVNQMKDLVADVKDDGMQADAATTDAPVEKKNG